MPESILRYKYLPMNKSSLKIISEGTMKFSSPSEFNDPFDCAPDYDVKTNLEYVSNNKDLFKIAGKKLGLSPAQRIQNKAKMLKRVERATSKEDYGSEIAEKTGICCLSRDALNLLMWAHYAKNHTGFVVEFCIPLTASGTIQEAEDFILKWLLPLKVDYTKDKPVINLNDSKDVNMQKQFLTKSIDWEYEQEERVIDYMRGSGTHSFDHKEILKSVIAGIKMDDKKYGELQSIVENMNKQLQTDVQVYRAIKSTGQFAIMVPERPDLNRNTQKT